MMDCSQVPPTPKKFVANLERQIDLTNSNEVLKKENEKLRELLHEAFIAGSQAQIEAQNVHQGKLEQEMEVEYAYGEFCTKNGIKFGEERNLTL